MRDNTPSIIKLSTNPFSCGFHGRIHYKFADNFYVGIFLVYLGEFNFFKRIDLFLNCFFMVLQKRWVKCAVAICQSLGKDFFVLPYLLLWARLLRVRWWRMKAQISLWHFLIFINNHHEFDKIWIHVSPMCKKLQISIFSHRALASASASTRQAGLDEFWLWQHVVGLSSHLICLLLISVVWGRKHLIGRTIWGKLIVMEKIVLGIRIKLLKTLIFYFWYFNELFVFSLGFFQFFL